VSIYQQLLHATRPLVGGGRLGVKVNRARAALRAVVELHAPVDRGAGPICAGCHLPGISFVWAERCTTVQAIARELGIEAGDHG
jgi:hypothetical protein